MANVIVCALLMEINGVMEIVDVRCHLACFYFHADNGLIVARNPAILQRAFNSLCALFDHMGLKINTKKDILLGNSVSSWAYPHLAIYGCLQGVD
jgi:hypothetical protein